MRTCNRKLARFGLEAIEQDGQVWIVECSRKAERDGNVLVVADKKYPVTPMRATDPWSKPLLFRIGTQTLDDVVATFTSADREARSATESRLDDNVRELADLVHYIRSRDV